MNDPHERSWRSEDPATTRAIGRELGRRLAPRGVLLLHGELGSGKTVLAQGVAEALGIPVEEVQSPSFTLIREHEGPGGTLVHVDLYRLDEEQVEGLGLEERFADGVVVVEWAERIPFRVPGALEVEIRSAGEGLREVRVVGSRTDGPEGGGNR